jgi:hypothetical protein
VAPSSAGAEIDAAAASAALRLNCLREIVGGGCWLALESGRGAEESVEDFSTGGMVLYIICNRQGAFLTTPYLSPDERVPAVSQLSQLSRGDNSADVESNRKSEDKSCRSEE